MFTSVHRIMDESPRWLMMEGRHEEAIKILKKMAKMNGRSLPEDRYLKVLTDKIDEEVSQICSSSSFAGRKRFSVNGETGKASLWMLWKQLKKISFLQNFLC